MIGGRKEECTCGHDKATHYRDDGAQFGPAGIIYSCLARGCACTKYVDANAYLAPKVKRLNAPYHPIDPSRNKPHIDAKCECDACFEWRWGFPRQKAKTDPWP